MEIRDHRPTMNRYIFSFIRVLVSVCVLSRWNSDDKQFLCKGTNLGMRVNYINTDLVPLIHFRFFVYTGPRISCVSPFHLVL